MEPARSTPETAPAADGSEQLPAEFAYFEKVVPAVVRVRQHGKPDRLRRAAKAWAGCWGAAIVAVFLPVLHFILVPSLLVGGPLYAMVMMREKVTVLGADGNCPACGAAQHPRPKAGASATMPFRCESCRRALELRLPAELLA
jgi:hypothetical protein